MEGLIGSKSGGGNQLHLTEEYLPLPFFREKTNAHERSYKKIFLYKKKKYFSRNILWHHSYIQKNYFLGTFWESPNESQGVTQ